MANSSNSRLTRNVRLILSSGAAIAIVLALNAAFLIYVLRESAIRDRSQQLINLTIVLSQQASQSMFSANTVIDRIIDVIESENIESEEDLQAYARRASTFELLNERARSNPIIDVVTLVGAEGRILNFSRAFPAPLIDLSDRDYFKWLKATDDQLTYYGMPVQNKGNGDWVFYLARRLNDTDHHFIGAVLIGVSVKVFSSFYQVAGQSLGTGAALTLYRDDHTLFTRWPINDNIIGRRNTGDVIRQSLDRVPLDGGAVLTKEPAFNFNNDLIDRMVSFRTVEGYPFVVGASLTKALYLQGWTDTYWTVLSSSVVSLVLLVSGMVLLIQAQQRNRRTQLEINRDSLTGLPNRVIFVEELQDAMVLARQNKTKVAVAFLDLDLFKETNDGFGHATGDLLLIELSKRIQACLRESDFVGRIGGDEFVLLIRDIDSVAAAQHLCEKIRMCVNQFFYFDDTKILPAVSIGLAVYPDHSHDEAKLLGKADRAMYLAKKAGRNKVMVSTLE